MGAGTQRWWRPTFAEECARHPASRQIADRLIDGDDGISVTLKLWTHAICDGCGIRFNDAHYCEHTHPYTVVLPR